MNCKDLTIESDGVDRQYGSSKVNAVSYHPQSPFEGEKRQSKNQSIHSGQNSIGKKSKKGAIILNKNMINFSGSKKHTGDNDKQINKSKSSSQQVDTLTSPPKSSPNN